MPDEVTVVVNSEQVDVLAPPAEIHLTVGVGASGTRGSKTLAGNTTPELFFAALGEIPLIGDMYLNISTQTMYQLVSTPTGSVWSLLFDIRALFSTAIAAVASSGGGSAIFTPDPTYPGLYLMS